MRVLLDECTPKALKRVLADAGHIAIEKSKPEQIVLIGDSI